jgi:hypothetical protein
VVECDLAKVEVAGSNPVSRSIFPQRCAPSPSPLGAVDRRAPGSAVAHVPARFPFAPPRRRRQVVRQRSAKPPSPVQIRAAPPPFARLARERASGGEPSDRRRVSPVAATPRRGTVASHAKGVPQPSLMHAAKVHATTISVSVAERHQRRRRRRTSAASPIPKRPIVAGSGTAACAGSTVMFRRSNWWSSRVCVGLAT